MLNFFFFLAVLDLCSSFLQLQRAKTLPCVWASLCGGFSCCGAQALGCGGSVVGAHRLSCSAACGIFPRPRLEPTSPALAGGFLSTVLPGKFQKLNVRY